MARVTKSTWYVGEHFDLRYILDHHQEHHLDSSELTRRNLSQDDQRRPKRTQIAAKFGKRHQSFDKISLFSPSPSRSPEADTIAALDTRLESEIERRANDVAALQRLVRPRKKHRAVASNSPLKESDGCRCQRGYVLSSDIWHEICAR